jgi:hypothetical protein
MKITEYQRTDTNRIRAKSCPSAFFPPQISHRLNWDWTRTTAFEMNFVNVSHRNPLPNSQITEFFCIMKTNRLMLSRKIKGRERSSSESVFAGSDAVPLRMSVKDACRDAGAFETPVTTGPMTPRPRKLTSAKVKLPFCTPRRHNKQWRYSSIHSEPPHYTKVSDLPWATLSPREERCVQARVWTPSRRYKYFAPVGNRTTISRLFSPLPSHCTEFMMYGNNQTRSQYCDVTVTICIHAGK